MRAPLWLWEGAILCAELWTACRKRLSSLIGDCWNVFISGIESVDGELFGRCVAIATSWLGYWNGWTLPEKINRIKDIFLAALKFMFQNIETRRAGRMNPGKDFGIY